MLTPYFLNRPSGRYVRFLVPAALQPLLGRRFIVRPLGDLSPSRSHLYATALAVALSEAFAAIRQGNGMADFDELLKGAKNAFGAGKAKEWSAENITVNNGVVSFSGVKTDGEKDSQDFINTVNSLTGNIIQSEPNGPLLGDEIPKHLDDLKRQGRAKDTITESRHTLKILFGIIGEKPINKINADDIRAFSDAIRWWPANATKKREYDGLTVKQIVQRGKDEQAPEPAKATLDKHYQRLAVFFNSLIDGGFLQTSPLNARNKKTGSKTEPSSRRPFTDGEIVNIFGREFTPWAKSPHRWWGPILALYSGARVTEIAQLYIADITKEAGIWGFHVNNRYYGQKLKNLKSRRFIPLHDAVLEAGFLEFVTDMKNTNQLRLFPHLPVGIDSKTGDKNGLGYGRQLSRQFGVYAKDLDIEKGLGFHAFRHNFISHLYRKGKDELAISKITGHTVVGSVMSRHYIDEPTLPERNKTVQLFQPIVEIPKYEKRQFSEVLRNGENFWK